MDDENGILVSALLRLHFSHVQTAELFKHIASKYHNHWDSVIKELQGLELEETGEKRRTTLARRAFLKWRRLAGHEPDLEGQMREGTGELFMKWQQGIAPMVEGRVVAASKSGQAAGKTQDRAGASSNEHSSQQENGEAQDSSRGSSGSLMKKMKNKLVSGLSKSRS